MCCLEAIAFVLCFAPPAEATGYTYIKVRHYHISHDDDVKTTNVDSHFVHRDGTDQIRLTQRRVDWDEISPNIEATNAYVEFTIPSEKCTYGLQWLRLYGPNNEVVETTEDDGNPAEPGAPLCVLRKYLPASYETVGGVVTVNHTLPAGVYHLIGLYEDQAPHIMRFDFAN